MQGDEGGQVQRQVVDRRVSIVIPCYNDLPEHLLPAVDSALRQTYPDTEVIVVNDGSTDVKTLQALETLAAGVQVVHRENGGPGSALNSGIAIASGEYILPMGADDLLPTNYVHLLAERLMAAPADVVAVFPSVEFFGERAGRMDGLPAEVRLEDIAVRNRVIAASLFRRSDWESVGGYGAFDDCSEDWYFWALLLGRRGTRMLHEQRAVFRYRIRPDSRNATNRGVARKQRARQHIADALPERLVDLYAAAADQADSALADAERYGAFVEGWRRRLAPIQPLYKHLHRLLPQPR